MWFFVPYKSLSELAQGEHTLNVKISTIDSTSSSFQLKFSIPYSSSKSCQPVINLGPDYGKLIFPVQVDGGRCYYYWDRSGDGTSDDIKGAGYNNSSDYASHDTLNQIFARDINGKTDGHELIDNTYLTDNTYRYATINGVHVALLTIGDNDVYLYLGWFATGTSIGSNPASNGSTAINPTYDDLLAVWDAYNGTGTETVDPGFDNYVDGTPPGWNDRCYWSATRSEIGTAPFYVCLDSGYVGSANQRDAYYVALEVL